MRLRNVLIFIAIALGVQAQSCHSDEQLFVSYLEGNMGTWKQYIDASCWDTMTQAERVRLVSYEYGYAAALLDTDKKQAAPYIRQYGEHIEALRHTLPSALYHVYMAAYLTYDLAVTPRNILAHKRDIFTHAQQAIAADSLNPLSWGIQANVHFYAPKGMGGNKRKAMREYEHADSLFKAQEQLYQTSWSYAAQALTLAQCYEKNGMLEQAIKQANAILLKWPQFEYVKHYQAYLMNLKARKKKNKEIKY